MNKLLKKRGNVYNKQTQKHIINLDEFHQLGRISYMQKKKYFFIQFCIFLRTTKRLIGNFKMKLRCSVRRLRNMLFFWTNIFNSVFEKRKCYVARTHDRVLFHFPSDLIEMRMHRSDRISHTFHMVGRSSTQNIDYSYLVVFIFIIILRMHISLIPKGEQSVGGINWLNGVFSLAYNL